MSNHERALQEARTRTEFMVEFEPDEPLDEDTPAAAISIADTSGTAMIVEIGSGPNGVYASVSGFADGEPAELQTFVSDNHALLIVDKEVK